MKALPISNAIALSQNTLPREDRVIGSLFRQSGPAFQSGAIAERNEVKQR
jgi:hypothetical protein